MATYGTDLSLVNACDSNTNWSELSGHQSGGAPSADTENYMQNSVSVSQSTGQASTTAAGMEYAIGSNLGTGWTSGHVFIAWQYYTAPTNINSWANGGMRIGIGSSSGNINFWNAMGDDFGGSPYACWQNTAIDPSDPAGTTHSHLAADTSDGSPTTGNYSLFGSLPNVRAKISKGSPHAVDIIRYGRGEIYATGTGGNFAGYAAANDGATARWGLFQAIRGGYLWKGLFSLGQSGTSLTFSDSNVNIQVDDTPRVQATFNKIQILNSSTSVTWVGVNINGVGTSITGSAPVSPGDFDNVDSGTVDWTGCTFTDLGTFVFDATTNTNDLDTCTWRRCGQVTQGGGDFIDCIFDKSSAAVALVVDDLDLIDNCRFVSSGTGHAVNLGTFSADDSIGWTNTESGYATQSGTAANRTILVNVASGFELTINVGTGASTPTYYNTGSGTVTVVSSFDHVLTGLELGTEVTYVTAGTNTELYHVESASVSDGDGKYKTTYQHGGGATVDVLIHHNSYKPDISNIIGITLPSSNTSVKVQMFSDENYIAP